ncbi:hypothetical protein EC988_004700, partial [Linderina pennispora]
MTDNSSTAAEPERCWICFEDIVSGKGEWVYPCKCSLVCHEDCLLHWIGESEGRSRTGVCNTPYQMVQWQSKVFEGLNYVMDLADKMIPLCLAGFGSMALVVAFTAHGAHTVMTVYGSADAAQILSRTGRTGQSKWLWLPMIPLTLIWTRFHGKSATLPLSSMLLLTSPLSKQILSMQRVPSPPMVLTAMPVVCTVYNLLWKHTLGRIERHWESQLPKEVPAVELRQFEFGRPAAVQEGEQDARDRRFRLNAHFFINGMPFNRMLTESLLLPMISAFCGKWLGKLPFLKGRGLGHFHRA